MKKIFTLSAVLTLISFIGFSQCPSHFGRNNGNANGSEGEIKMYFSSCPAVVPGIDSIYSNGVNTAVSIVSIDSSKCKSQGYVSYYLSANIAPVHALNIYFNYGSTDVDPSSCKVTDQVVEAGTMPVVLSSFEVQRNASSVVANWKTEQEINSDRYELQRSINNGAYETVGTVYSKFSNSSTAQYYSFTDNSNNFSGVSLYRIKMIDKDNSFSYSPVKTVKGSTDVSGFNIYPNPSVGNAKVAVAFTKDPTNVFVFDNSGRLVQHGTITNSSYDITNLQKGGYIVKVINEKTGATSVKKLAVVN